ncbi:twin-arginine translocase TatA/TatE family subunit [Bowmanella sp. Y26]|uniref:Sec-independent protein translocase subunit TatA/TatB n=1 Tax=Bowmanella yangjiangensis TaxID=2811230 RepID=UPI001BDD76B4|nr:twin-arginine translocase TatA/TatE family subunit [Bowmanella yangjiangensis]MBT1064199.1 twin-arginine translocase TatA/TatE family subunit [Bowmanella yangjiangensis]
MFDLSWMELLFVGVLALLVIGPKDLPALFRTGGQLLAKVRRMYKDMLGSINQLEREVDIASGNSKQPDEQWRQWLPEEVRNLPADFQPGSMSAEQHAERRRLLDEARQREAENQEPQS